MIIMYCTTKFCDATRSTSRPGNVLTIVSCVNSNALFSPVVAVQECIELTVHALGSLECRFWCFPGLLHLKIWGRAAISESLLQCKPPGQERFWGGWQVVDQHQKGECRGKMNTGLNVDKQCFEMLTLLVFIRRNITFNFNILYLILYLLL